MLADAPAAPVVRQAAPAPAPARWTLVRVSPSGRTLVVGARDDGCRGDFRATVAAQDATAVRLTVTYAPAPPRDDSGGVNRCFVAQRVTLDRPLAGRALPGQARLAGWPPMPASSATPVPRLIGVRARDALPALRNQGFRAHLAGPADGVVVHVRRRAGRQDESSVTVVAARR